MLKEPLMESHVISIFVDNIFSMLKFIAMDFTFSGIFHRLIQKEKCMVEIGKLNYDNA